MNTQITCAEATNELQKLKDLEREFLNYSEIVMKSTNDISQRESALARVQELKKELEQRLNTVTERADLHFMEREFRITDQYKKQLQILRSVGVLDATLSNGEEGIYSIKVDGKAMEYPVPTLKEVTQRLKNLEDEFGKGFLEMKKAQGFERVLLVPFGMSLDVLIDIYRRVLLGHHKRNELFRTKKDGSELIQEVDLKREKPLNISDRYEQGDIKEKIVYEVERFEEKDHGGKTKAEILKERLKQSQQGITKKDGWNVLLLEKEINIPREGKGKKLGPVSKLRAQIETNRSPIEYLEFLLENFNNKDSPYQGEQGLVPEEWLMLAITYLDQENQVIDDRKGNGSSTFNLGAFFPAFSFVPYACFNSDNMQTDWYGSDRLDSYPHVGMRSGVRG